MDELTWLQQWFRDHCNGDWEHFEGIKLASLDNPGWMMRINLVDTEMEGIPFKNTSFEHSPLDWHRCWVEDNVFLAAGGAMNLSGMIGCFREWVTQHLAKKQ